MDPTQTRARLVDYSMVSASDVDMNKVRAVAVERLVHACRVCRICDGRACAGLIPGFGGVGTGASFVSNVEALSRRKLNLRVLHDAVEPDIRTRLFGLDLSMPVLGAAVAGIRVNRIAGLSEQELADAMVLGPASAGSVGMGGDGGDPEVFRCAVSAAARANGRAIAVIKPRQQRELLDRIAAARAAGVAAIGVDVDAAGLVNMALLGQKVEPKPPTLVRELVQAADDKPLILKGIMTVEDALIAADAGAAAIVVSNHGDEPWTTPRAPPTCCPRSRRQCVAGSRFLRTAGSAAASTSSRCWHWAQMPCWLAAHWPSPPWAGARMRCGHSLRPSRRSCGWR